MAFTIKKSKPLSEHVDIYSKADWPDLDARTKNRRKLSFMK